MTRATKALLAILTGLALMASGMVLAQGAAGDHPHNPEATYYQRTIERGCTIRFDERDAAGNTVPSLYTNGAHYCVGVDGLSINGDGWLVIHSSHTEPLMDIQVQSDETLGPRGIDCYPSGGGAQTVLYCYDREGRPIKARFSHMYGPTSNLFISWTHYAGPGYAP